MRVALHWSMCRDDACDAYQRALEIYLRRVETLDPATEVGWLKVVVKHEALAVRRQRADALPADDADLDARPAEAQRPVDDLLAGRERVERSAEALRRIKPDEARALVLKAQGLSYREIGESLGWTYTKVNRCLTEGRARFLRVFAEIEAGDECERFAPTLASLAGGTATADALLELRPHIRNCATCRATVRDLHASRLGRLGALWPIPLLVAPLRWIGSRFGDSTPGPQRRPEAIVDLDAAVRDRALPDPAPSRWLDIKAELYQWWHRLSGSDVATSAQLAASSGGGGRVATIGAIIGLCLSGVGAGTVCVVTGVIHTPLTPQQDQTVERPRPKHDRPSPPRRLHERPTPIAAATPAPTPAAAKPTAPKRSAPRRGTVRDRERPATPVTHEAPPPAPAPTGATQDFAVESAAPATASQPAPAPVNGGGEFAP